jgi:hypothetical protein
MLLRLLLVMMFSVISMSSHAWMLTYRVMNASSGIVKFSSTDWFDFGTRIYYGQTKQNTYYFAPKNMYLTLYNYDGSRFTVNTASGCDLIGFPPLRGNSKRTYQLTGSHVRFSSGIVDIVIKDIPGSTYYNKSISCSLAISK